jgi:hypothetical protein
MGNILRVSVRKISVKRVLRLDSKGQVKLNRLSKELSEKPWEINLVIYFTCESMPQNVYMARIVMFSRNVILNA